MTTCARTVGKVTMVTARDGDLTPPEVIATSPTPATCAICRGTIVYMRTHYGRALSFDADPKPRTQGDLTCGWIAGYFRIDGTMQVAMGPAILIPRARSRKVKTTMRLHQCRAVA